MLAAEQMARLLEAIEAEEEAGANPIACAAIRVVFWTGWRIGEVLGLEWAAEEEYRQLPATEGHGSCRRLLEIAPRFPQPTCKTPSPTTQPAFRTAPTTPTTRP